MNADRVNALLCAIQELEGTAGNGTAGGFSEHEKQNAINILHQSVPDSDVAIAALNGFGQTISKEEKREQIEKLRVLLAEEEKKED